MITEDQKNNIHKLSADDCLIIMHECAERLELVSIEEYQKITLIPRRSIYAKIESGNIKTFEIGNHKYPCIND